MYTSAVLCHRTTHLSVEERMRLEGAIARVETIKAGQTAVHQNSPIDISLLLVDGFMTRHVDAKDGKRHLVAVHIPGDFVDLHAYALKRLDHDVGALTDVTVAVFPHSRLDVIQQEDTHLAKRLWFLTMLDAAMHRKWIYRLSSLNALQRVGHFLCETNARMLAIGASSNNEFALPMTQFDIGEVCSLTNVHVNRVLRELRDLGVVQIRSSKVQILDLARLCEISLFEPAYLYLDHETATRVVA